MKVAVIVPALDEEAAIGSVVRGVPAMSGLQVIVADNGSIDRTPAVAAGAGATVVQERRRGYGFACMAGVGAAPEADTYVFLDGDGSDPPHRIPDLLALLDRADLVLGVRSGAVEPGAMLWHQRLGNRFMSRFISLLTGQAVSDLPSFKAIDGGLLRTLSLAETQHGWTVELITKACCRGARILEVETGYRRRIGRSKVSGSVKGAMAAAFRMNRTIVQTWWSERDRSSRQKWWRSSS